MTVKMECFAVDDGLEKYRKVFICEFAVFCKLLGLAHDLMSHWFGELGL